MHLDWERLSLSGYFEALEANNETHSGDKAKPDADLGRLRKFMDAHNDG